MQSIKNILISRALTDSTWRLFTALGRRVASSIVIAKLYNPRDDEDNTDVKTDPSLIA